MKTRSASQPVAPARSRGVLPLLILLALSCPPRVGRPDGVTLITHGANPSGAASPTWMASMRDAMAARFLRGAPHDGTITVTGSAGALVATCSPWNVDLSAGSDSEATMGATERAAWFNASEAAGANTGFVYSRLHGGGDRSSPDRPVPGEDAIRTGLHHVPVLGGDGVRSNLTWSSAVWPNVARLDVLDRGTALAAGAYQVAVGSTLQLRYVYLDYDSGCTVTLHADVDRNPYNNNDAAILATQSMPAPTGSTYAENTFAWNTSGLAPGTTLFVRTQVTDGPRTRFMYALPALHLVSGAVPQPAIVGTRRSGSSVIFTGGNGQPHATFYLLESTNVALPSSQWSRISTNVFDAGGTFAVTNTVTVNVPHAFYQLSD